ncbi:MAG: radical SAM protein [Desulfurococcaceae archaeon]
MKPKYFVPFKRYKPLSLTGSWCALKCRFCEGRYLKNMVPVNPDNVEEVLLDLYQRGVRGVLISGGFRPDGTLPIEPYIDKLRRVKKRLNMVMSAHLGLVKDPHVLQDLKDVIDVVDYEFTLSPYIIKSVRGLSVEPGDYIKSLKLITEAGLRVVPHMFAWHPGASVKSVEKELHILEDMDVREITLLVYVDEAYRLAARQLASLVEELVVHARDVFSGKLYLGCMRPGFLKPLLDTNIVERGYVERIANPYYRLRNKLPGEVYDACCSLDDSALTMFKGDK